VDNLNAAQQDGSFINFVCTGADDFENTNAGLQYTTQYANAVNAITAVPKASFTGYVDAIKSLNGKDKALSLPDVKTQQFEACRTDVSKDVPPTGYDAATGRNEAVLAASASIAAIETLITTVEQLATDIAKAVTEAEQRDTLKKFIVNNKNNYNQVLAHELSSTELQSAFERRRKVAVAIPYYEFLDMMKLSTTTDRTKIVRSAAQISSDLAEYDAIRLQKPPALIVATFKDINQKLEDYADGKVALSDFIEFLSETASELTAAKKDYDAVAAAVPPVLKDLGVK
jgi:hypothetical protein